jgi:hypothetical protein
MAFKNRILFQKYFAGNVIRIYRKSKFELKVQYQVGQKWFEFEDRENTIYFLKMALLQKEDDFEALSAKVDK